MSFEQRLALKAAEPISLRAFSTSAMTSAGGQLITGFEPAEGFAPGYIEAQAGWTAFQVSAIEGHIDTVNPARGVQHLRISFDPAVGTEFTGTLSPEFATPPSTASTTSIDVAIGAVFGADYIVAGQSNTQGFLTWEVRFGFLGSFLVLDNLGPGFVFIDTGARWTAGPYKRLTVCDDPVAGTTDYYYDGVLFYQQVTHLVGNSVEQIVIVSDNLHRDESGDFDNVLHQTGITNFCTDGCATNADCTSGFCVDGICCDRACDGLCERCDLPDSVGTCATPFGDNPDDECPTCTTCGVSACVAVGAGTDPLSDCTGEDPATCGQTGACDGAGACALFESGTVCAAAASCGATEGLLNEADSCDGAGVCATGASIDCAPFLCDPSGPMCTDTCVSNADCVSNGFCQDAACLTCPGGQPPTDTDGDGVPDCVDPCPADSPDDTDQDGVCDSNDRCPGVDDLADNNGDGTPDCLQREPIPTISEWGVAILALLLIAAQGACSRRRAKGG